MQQGLIPLSAPAIERAIELNGAAVKLNLAAFRGGRRWVVDPAAVARAAGVAHEAPPQTLDQLIAHRAEHLTAYQNAEYAARYRALVQRVRAAEAEAAPGSTRLTHAVAHNYARLLAYKDEYEVARLYASPAFRERLEGRSRSRCGSSSISRRRSSPAAIP